MKLREEIQLLKTALKESEAVQVKLDRNVFHLRTLYDVSCDIYHSMEAARTALAIKKETTRIFNEIGTLYKPLEINMGINSGIALVGAAKFDSYTGSRWTYTARGGAVNIAARIGKLATGGRILVSRQTSEQLAGRYRMNSLGLFR